MTRCAAPSFVSVLTCCLLAACGDGGDPVGDASTDAAILVDAPGLDAALDAGETDAGPPMRLDVEACVGFDLPFHWTGVECSTSEPSEYDCATLRDGPAFSVVGRDLCAEALASSDGHARVQFAPAVDVLDVSCDGLVLAARAGTDRVRVDFHGHAPIANALANDAPFSVEAEAAMGSDGCVATLVVRTPWRTIVLGELPAVGGRVSFGSATPPTTIEIAPLYEPGTSCDAVNAACITPSYGDRPGTPVVASFCSFTQVQTADCGGDYLAIGTTACDARLRLGALIPSYVRICL